MRYSRRVLAFLLTILLVVNGSGINSVPEIVWAEDENNYQGFSYVIGDDMGITITGYSGTEKNVVIPEMIDNRKVTKIAVRAFENSEMVSVTIPQYIGNIGRGAFANCSDIKEINFNAKACSCDFSFSNIGMNSGNVKVVFGDTVNAIPDSLFYKCEYIKSILIGDNVRTIGDYSFWGTSINELTIPEGVNKIENGAFDNCAF